MGVRPFLCLLRYLMQRKPFARATLANPKQKEDDAMKAITTSITAGQQKQYKRFVEDAAERALKETALDKDGLQKLIENGDEFQSRIVTAIRELSVSNQ